MIILRNKKFSSKKEQSDLDKTSKKYLAGSAGLAGLGGYLVKTSNTPVKIKTDEELKSEGLKLFDKLQKEKKRLEDAQSTANPEMLDKIKKRLAEEESTYHKEIDKLFEKNKAAKRLKTRLGIKKSVGQHALVGAAGLTAAAGYRYYRNKKKKAKKSISEKTYSIRNKKLPDSRIGIGWINDKNGKYDSETYFRAAQKSADDSWKRGDSEEKVVKKAKRAAGRKALTDSSGKPLTKAAIAGGLTFAAGKLIPIEDLPRLGERALGMPLSYEARKGITKAGRIAKKHTGKIALGVSAASLAPKVPGIYKKVKSARLGAEINTEDRIKKSKKK